MTKPIQAFADRSIVESFEVPSLTDNSYSTYASNKAQTWRNSVSASSKLERQLVLCKHIKKFHVCLALAIILCVGIIGGLVWNILYSFEIGRQVGRLDSRVDTWGKEKEKMTGRSGPQDTMNQLTQMVMTTTPVLSTKSKTKTRRTTMPTETTTIPSSPIPTSPNTTSTTAADYAFTVLQHKTTHYRGYDFLAVQVRVPGDGLSRTHNWCRDYQHLCEHLATQAVACGYGYHRSPYTECKEFYGAYDLLPGSILTCPPRNIRALAGYAFPDASPEPSRKIAFGFYNCSSTACQKTLWGSRNALSSVDGFWEENASTMYTVCVGTKL